MSKLTNSQVVLGAIIIGFFIASAIFTATVDTDDVDNTPQ